jgi:hypothetical protein
MKLFLLSILLTLTLFSCKKDEPKKAINYAYLGGEIINPNNNYVVISKSDKVLDTIQLDSRNRFLYKIENLKEGLYTFHHGGEIQMVLLEPTDSIIFRLNTLEFDESLVFTGEGDKKNNYLINEFLENETQEKKIFKLCQLNPNVYEKRVDSIKALKLTNFKDFKSKHETSKLFNDIALANINYNYYSSKEVYPFVHYGNDKGDILKSIPIGFYNYRKDINYNDDSFKDYHYYSSFLRHSINNLALKNHITHNKSELFNRADICYNLDRLDLIDSLVENKTIKDDLLSHFTMNFLSKSTDAANNTKMLNSYLSKAKDENGKVTMTRFAESLNKLNDNAQFPDINLTDYNGSEININTLIKTPTVVCFWSQTFYEHFRGSHSKIKELKLKYPEVAFIVINIDDYGLETPKKSMVENKFKFTNEYLFKNPSESIKTLAIQPITKAIIVDKNQRIVNSNTNIFSQNFEQQLLGLINR